MKGLLLFALGVAVVATSFGATIDISTGTGNANWQVSGPGVTGSVAATTVTTNNSWAPAPSGSSWISWGSQQSTGCVIGQTPGNGCASTNFNTTLGDVWTYTLDITAAQLGATSGTLNFLFGSDDTVTLLIGAVPGGTGATGLTTQTWNLGGSTVGFNPLGCSGSPNPGSGGNTQTQYNQCTSTLAFNSTFLQSNGDLLLTAQVTNLAIQGCPACGNPTGLVVEGTVLTGGSIDPSATPEPATFGLVSLAGVAGLLLRRKQRG